MESGKFGRGVKMPTFQLEHGAELEGWKKFIRRFEVAVIGAGFKRVEGSRTRSADEKIFDLEQRKAALLLDSMGEIGMRIFEAWDGDTEAMQYEELKKDFEGHFAAKENIVATRHRFMVMSQRAGENIDDYVERVETAGRVCRWGTLEQELALQVLIKGMREEKLRKELLLKKNLDLGKAKELCVLYESAMIASEIITRDSTKLVTVERVEQDSQEGDVNRVQEKTNRGGGPKCFSCGVMGHMAKDCSKGQHSNSGGARPRFQREPLKCYNCGETGHFARSCKKPKKGYPDRPRTGKDRKVNVVEASRLFDSDTESL